MLCGSCRNPRFGGIYRLNYQGGKSLRAKNDVSSNQQPKHAMKHVLNSFENKQFRC
jgi:hypothetical protein